MRGPQSSNQALGEGRGLGCHSGHQHGGPCAAWRGGQKAMESDREQEWERINVVKVGGRGREGNRPK